MPLASLHLKGSFLGYFLLLLVSCHRPGASDSSKVPRPPAGVSAVNERTLAVGSGTKAVVHCRIITGDGVTVIEDGAVVVEGSDITAVGTFGNVTVPTDAETFDATGLTLLPGFVDAHFHLNRIDSLPALFLQNGITSLRDPGAWIEDFAALRQAGEPIPRLFLTGPHIDMFPPAYPENSFVVRDAAEARAAVHKFANQGASAIKVYFRSSDEVIRAVCEAARERGVPVTAHLEITDIYQAVRLGLDGIEHVTSLGSNLVPAPRAEAYKQAILNDNNARRQGRYDMWDMIDPASEAAVQLGKFLAERNVYVCPTLGAFEYRPGENALDSVKQRAFGRMMEYTKVLHEQGVPVVVGSHSRVKYAETGWAFHHEMQLFEELGMKPLQIIKAATADNAAFFRVQDRLGTVAEGKQADLLLVEGNPLRGVAAVENVRRVMLAGRWVE